MLTRNSFRCYNLQSSVTLAILYSSFEKHFESSLLEIIFLIEFSQRQPEIDNWITKDWTPTSSLFSNHYPVTDKRWEGERER
jgi:hypothetical protein